MRSSLYMAKVILVITSGVRAVTNDPTLYAPTSGVACPSTQLLRTFSPINQTLHPLEEDYGVARATIIQNEWKNWLGDGASLGYNFSQFITNGSLPLVGIAVSGGGHRAAQYGAGTLSGLDSRNSSSKESGTGGLLQVSSYLAGLSGGSWLTASMLYNDFPGFYDLVLGNISSNITGWLLDIDLALPGVSDLLGDGIIEGNIFDEKNQYFYGSIIWSVISKARKAVQVSITDPWARALSYHFLTGTTRDDFFSNSTAHGAGVLWSDIPSIPSFRSHSIPFPIVLACSQQANDTSDSGTLPNSTIYEVTPFEFGSFDVSLSAFADIKFAGTQLLNGRPSNDSACVQGFDQAGFIIGTSSSLFNSVLDKVDKKLLGLSKSVLKVFTDVLRRLLDEVEMRAEDVANWPNPFQGINPSTFQDSTSASLELVDGGLGGENLPLAALLVKARKLEVIVAIDATSNDDDNWPTGKTLFSTQSRIAQFASSISQSLPPLPSNVEDFVKFGLNRRPTFFGCNPKNTPPEWPLLIYLPNSPPLNGDSPVTNAPTTQTQYSQRHSELFLSSAQLSVRSGFTPGSTKPDNDFGKCLQCATIDRARAKTIPMVPRSGFCISCFTTYCFEEKNTPGEIVGRTFKFKNPDGTVAQIAARGLFKRHRVIVIVMIVLVSIISGGLVGYCLICFNKKQRYSRLRPKMDIDDAAWERGGVPLRTRT